MQGTSILYTDLDFCQPQMWKEKSGGKDDIESCKKRANFLPSSWFFVRCPSRLPLDDLQGHNQSSAGIQLPLQRYCVGLMTCALNTCTTVFWNLDDPWNLNGLLIYLNRIKIALYPSPSLQHQRIRVTSCSIGKIA